MAVSLENCVVVMAAILSVTALLTCLGRMIWVYHLFVRHRLYLKDFKKLSHEAEEFCAETAAVYRHVEHNVVLEASIKAACLQIMNAASEYDTGIRIALSAWEDEIYPAQDSDMESGKHEGTEKERMPGKNQRRYVVALMRKRCLEGIENRRMLGPQMQWILTNFICPYVVC